MIDTRLNTLLTLVELKSYTKTADALFITQPAVTHHIKSIEKENNIKLFSNPKTFKLSLSGQIIHDYALKSKEQYNQLKLALEINVAPKRVLNFAVTSQIASSFIKPVITNWASIHSKDQIIMSVDNFNNIVDKISDGAIDFAIIDQNFDKHKYEHYQLFKSSIILVVSPKHHLSHKQKMRVDALKEENLIIDVNSSGLRKVVEAGLMNKNILLSSFNNIMEISDPQIVKTMLINGLGIGFVYMSAVIDEINEGTLKQIELFDLDLKQEFYLVGSKDSLTKSRFHDIAEEMIELNREYMIK